MYIDLNGHTMSKKQLLIALLSNKVPSGDLKKEMFELHNSLYGKSRHIRKVENPKTFCGTCIQRVRTSVWKWYHFDPSAPKYKGLEFTGKFGIYNTPIYVYNDGK